MDGQTQRHDPVYLNVLETLTRAWSDRQSTSVAPDGRRGRSARSRSSAFSASSCWGRGIRFQMILIRINCCPMPGVSGTPRPSHKRRSRGFAGGPGGKDGSVSIPTKGLRTAPRGAFRGSASADGGRHHSAFLDRVCWKADRRRLVYN